MPFVRFGLVELLVPVRLVGRKSARNHPTGQGEQMHVIREKRKSLVRIGVEVRQILPVVIGLRKFFIYRFAISVAWILCEKRVAKLDLLRVLAGLVKFLIRLLFFRVA